MFPSFLELLKASLGHKNVNFNYFSMIHGQKKISCSGATSNCQNTWEYCHLHQYCEIFPKQKNSFSDIYFCLLSWRTVPRKVAACSCLRRSIFAFGWGFQISFQKCSRLKPKNAISLPATLLQEIFAHFLMQYTSHHFQENANISSLLNLLWLFFIILEG